MPEEKKDNYSKACIDRYIEESERGIDREREIQTERYKESKKKRKIHETSVTMVQQITINVFFFFFFFFFCHVVLA